MLRGIFRTLTWIILGFCSKIGNTITELLRVRSLPGKKKLNNGPQHSWNLIFLFLSISCFIIYIKSCLFDYGNPINIIICLRVVLVIRFYITTNKCATTHRCKCKPRRHFETCMYVYRNSRRWATGWTKACSRAHILLLAVAHGTARLRGRRAHQ